MTDDAEWGPWVDHDGKGCPFRDRVWIQIVATAPECPVVSDEDWSDTFLPESWDSANWGRHDCRDGVMWGIIQRYRVRKPKALRDLIRLVEQPYAPPPVIAPEGPVRQPDRVPA